MNTFLATMEFITFEDETDAIETTFFPQTCERSCVILDRSRPFMLYCLGSPM